MRQFLFAVTISVISSNALAASVSVEACTEFEVLQASAPGVINSVPERCINVVIEVESGKPNDTITQSESRRDSFAYGGCNTSGTDVTYSAERRVRYSIVEQSFPSEERTRARVEYSWISDVFTSGSGSMTQIIDGTISNGVCADFFGNFSVFAEASSGLDPDILTNQTGVTGLFYDQNNPGHGLNFIRHQSGFTVYYYGHTPAGERLWLVSDLYTDPMRYFLPIEIEMFEVTDGGFGMPMLPETSWGNIRILLDDCDSGDARLDGADGQLEFDFVRLAGLEYEDCY